MNSFNKIVLTISIIVLITCLVILGIFLAKSLFDRSYPPIVSTCPDYWDISINDGNYICYNRLRSNGAYINRAYFDSSCVEFNYSEQGITEDMSEQDKLCEKYKYTKQCHPIIWDGVTNNNKLDKCQ